MPHEVEGQRVLIRKYREVTSDGVTRIFEVCAEGVMDAAGRIRLIACAGRLRCKPSCRTNNKQSAA